MKELMLVMEKRRKFAMRWQVLLFFAAGALIAADKLENMTSEQIKDYERLTGTFTLVSGVVDGKEVPEDVRKETILVTDHDKFTVSTGDKAGTSERGTFKIDPTKTPKTADSLQETGADKGKTMLGIYDIIDDNHKRACWAPPDKPRPNEFASEPGSGHILQLWERQRQK
jgi:uncharacterized protein (TIGR03067 family)